MDQWSKIDFSDLDTPCLIIDRQKVKSNIEKAINIAGGVDRLRPHVKTHKTLEVAQMQVAAGLYKFKCATISEAEMLGLANAGDVLVAYQPQGPKIERVVGLARKFPRTTFSILIDNIASANACSEHFKNADLKIGIYIDVNDGQDRTGIRPSFVETLVEGVQQLDALDLKGLHCYDGHIRMADYEERESSVRTAFQQVIDLHGKLEDRLARPLTMVAGGSPSFPVHAKFHDVECSPGTFIFWDQRYSGDYAEQPFEKAAVLATRVISKIDTHAYCFDLGHKSVASEFPFPRVSFISDHVLEQIGHSEEHLVVRSEQADILKVGDLLMAYPYHICPTVALYDQLVLIKDGRLIDRWKVIARNRKISI